MVASLLFVALASAGGYLYHRQGGTRLTAGLFVALLLLGSAAPFAALTPGVDEFFPASVEPLMAFALVVLGLLLAYSPERFGDGGSEKLYGELDSRRLLAVVWIAMAAGKEPVCLVFLAPVLAAVPPPERRGSTWKWMLVLSLVAIAAMAAIAGYIVWKSPQAYISRLEPSLLGWNLSYLVAGRNFGLLVWYLPALLLIACYRRRSRRGWLLASIAIGALGLLIASPWDLRGADELHLNASFLPLYGALWFVPMRVPRARWLALTAVAAGLVLWPAWWAPLATAAGEDRPAAHAGSLASRLPYETTQEYAPYTAEWSGTGVLSRALGPGLEDGEDGPALVPSAGPATLMIAAAKPLEAVLLDFGHEAGTELSVVGGEAGNTVFRPDGGVRFEVVLDRPDRSHPMWFSPKRHYVYLLELEMPDAPERSLPVAIMARPEEALPRSLDPSTAGQDP